MKIKRERGGRETEKEMAERAINNSNLLEMTMIMSITKMTMIRLLMMMTMRINERRSHPATAAAAVGAETGSVISSLPSLFSPHRMDDRTVGESGK